LQKGAAGKVERAASGSSDRLLPISPFGSAEAEAEKKNRLERALAEEVRRSVGSAVQIVWDCPS